MAPCKFFAQGRCLFGASCKNSHEALAVGLAEQVLSSPSKGTPLVPSEAGMLVVCHFFARGSCKYGATCRHLHPQPKGNAVDSLPQSPSIGIAIRAKNGPDNSKNSKLLWRPEAPVFEPGAAIAVKISPSKNDEGSTVTANVDKGLISADLLAIDEVSREINGANATFKIGAEVAQLQLLSDFSTVQIEGLDTNTQVAAILTLLASLGSDVPHSSVVVRKLGDKSCVAEVKVEDPNFATNVIRNLASQQSNGHHNDISIKPVVRAAASGASGNRLQVSTVTCTWYQASRVAWLSYSTRQKADDGKLALESRRILNRTVTCSVMQNYGNPRVTSTLQVTNLHGSTTEADLLRFLSGNQRRPKNVTLGRPSYSYSDTKSADVVEALLKEVGGLESFQSSAIDGSSKMKAMAHFSERAKAVEAVRKLHNTTVSELGKTKIFVAHVISVKYNVLNGIMKTLHTEIDKLRERSWKESHVQLKIYPQTDLRKPFTTLRISGENLKTVATAKAALEKMLAGTKILNGDSPIWDPWFLEPSALIYLNDLSDRFGLYIHQDTRKSQLVIYSVPQASLEDVERILLGKALTLKKASHTMILSPELLKKAMQGGMQRLKARFGSAVKLDISASPKTISVTGSKAEIEEAQALLVIDTPSNTEEATRKVADCVVCWCEASEPLVTVCEHTYCTECFSNQASTEEAIPVRCFGDESNCKHIFGMEELKSMLPHDVFENLLRRSFDTFVRHHPEQFQYCPTPDCPQIYRKTTTGETFLCSTCLTPVCTSCHVISHDGMSCEEYKDLSSEGTEAFRKYKKEHDVRDCPKCKVGIEKNHGCNHMECANCHAHICWFCMEVFSNGGHCYTHMQGAHGSIQ